MYVPKTDTEMDRQAVTEVKTELSQVKKDFPTTYYASLI